LPADLDRTGQRSERHASRVADAIDAPHWAPNTNPIVRIYRA
jgi:hypothetical protein